MPVVNRALGLERLEHLLLVRVGPHLEPDSEIVTRSCCVSADGLGQRVVEPVAVAVRVVGLEGESFQ